MTPSFPNAISEARPEWSRSGSDATTGRLWLEDWAAHLKGSETTYVDTVSKSTYVREIR
jgi:hypothetical protein